ncbi:hypothetical protein QA612_00180 [Evansella sp. AB-P1]|uniref:hypothetical protein n=1 Tax=Evansella sp. AB-P1 TaxID=3037653 RepID=UPI00241E84DD|nr:hypothetical protein [Evansella sp. AB-P1]MDG5785887.1 hypothetical protein [Evansella sp. AB-P1]
MIEDKEIPVTLVSGLSDSLKLSFIKEIKLQKNSKVILLRDPTVVYEDISAEDFYQENILTEVVHDREACTKKDLVSIIKDQSNKEVDQLIIDLEKFSNIQLLFPYYSNMEDDYLLNLKHIHIIDTGNFWFQYSSNEYIVSQSFNGEEKNETSVGELLISPLEMADLILLGNVDKINQERLAELNWFFSKLNPLAKIITITDFTKDNSLSRKQDSIKKHTPHELYTYQLHQFEQSKPLMLVGDYGIDVYIYRSTSPISMKHLEDFLAKLPEGILQIFRTRKPMQGVARL